MTSIEHDHVDIYPTMDAYVDAFRLFVAKVPEEEVRQIVGENAIDLWGFDREKLQPLVDAHGPTMAEILRIPDEDHFPRGDVHKPFGDPR